MQRSGSAARRLTLAVFMIAAAMALLDSILVSREDFMLHCMDNSGAWKLKVMGVSGKGHAPRAREIRPGDLVVVVGRTGGSKNKVLRAIVTRLRRNTPSPLRNGFRSAFDTNCAVLVDKDCNPVGSKILGKIDPLCALKWPKLAQIATGR
eukprot:TRINITY_DN4891_c0_g1_i1.p1 TRINITY_DN4891_c0_g1~~TRINITY_DN4891_c0_g1_i1.p1  ORF type:complete len:150 (-),score=28.04 TRINITY_DN4891_c0_g1_i1:51-500(-)